MATPKLERIDRNPQYAALVAEVAEIERHLAKIQKRRETAHARLRGAKAARSASEMAVDIMKGAVLAGDPRQEIQKCDEEDAIMVAALRTKTAALNSLVGDLSLTACRKLEAEHTACLRRAVAAIKEMGAAFVEAIELRAKVRDAGYQVLENTLPGGLPPFVLAIGTGEGDGRQLHQYRRYLETHTNVKL